MPRKKKVKEVIEVKIEPVLGVYEHTKGSDIWYVRYRVQRKLVRKRIGTLEAANAYIESLREARKSGGGIIPLSARGSFKTSAQLVVEATAAEAAKVAAQNGVLVGELCDGLLKELMETPEADHRTPPSRIARIKRELGQRVATSIQPQEIKKWLNGLRSESIYPKREEGVVAPKVNPATANRLRTQLSAIYEFGRTEGLLPRAFRNPVRDVKAKKIGIRLKRWMDDAEEARLREVVQGWVDSCGQGPKHEKKRKRLTHHLKELDVVLNSGIRKTNMFSIRWPQVDFDRHQVTLGETITLGLTKNRDPLIVPLNEDAEAALRWLKANPMKRKSRSGAQPNQAPADSVFSLANPRKWLQKALKEAGITAKFRWHDTRHTVGTRMGQEGVALKTIMEVLGQKTPQAALGYQHMADKQRNAAVGGLSRAGRAAAQLKSRPA